MENLFGMELLLGGAVLAIVVLLALPGRKKRPPQEPPAEPTAPAAKPGRCPKCGAKRPEEGGVFCVECGARLPGEK